MKTTLAPPGRLARRHRRLLIGLAVLGALLYAAAWWGRTWQIAREDERLDRLIAGIGARGVLRESGRTRYSFYPPSRNWHLSFPAGATPEALAPLASVPPNATLSLDLSASGLTDAGLAHLRGVAAIDHLNLGNRLYSRLGGVPNQITGAGLAHLTGLDALNHLDLSDLGLTDDALARLPPMSKVYALSIAGNAIRGPGLRALAGHPSLMSLDLSGNPLTDAGLAELPTLNLYQLNLDRTHITPGGLATLSTHKRLTQVTIEQGQFSPADVDAIKAAGYRFVLTQTPKPPPAPVTPMP